MAGRPRRPARRIARCPVHGKGAAGSPAHEPHRRRQPRAIRQHHETGGVQAKTRTSPLFWYPYQRAREALETLEQAHDAHPCWGHKLQYTNPVTGDWAMPTIGTFLQLLPKGFKGKAYRSSDSTVYAVVEGKGRCRVGGEILVFGPRDVFVCPSWLPYNLEADEQAVLFTFWDRPL